MPTPSTPSTAMSEDTLRIALAKAFPTKLLDMKHPCMSSLTSILRIYTPNLTAEDLYYKTEAILMKHASQTLTQDVVDELKSNIQRDWEAKARSTSSAPSKTFSTPAIKARPGLGSLLGITPQTPKADPATTVATSSAAATPESPIPVQGSIIETLNPHIVSKEVEELQALMNLDEDVKPKIHGLHSRVALAIGMDPRTWNYRYMFERPGTKGQVLDEGLEDMTAVILDTYKLAREDVADPSVTSQATVFVVGRVCAALTRADKIPRLNDGMVLEASRTIGSGSRTPLRFAGNVVVRGLPFGSGPTLMHSGGNGRQMSVFPGMMAGFKGRNGGGNCFVVEEVFFPPALPHPATLPSDLWQHQYSPTRLDGDSLQVCVASGPYTSDDNLDFAPWHRLIDQVELQKPDVILLLGPFLSVQHTRLMDADLSELPYQIFQRHISQRLNRLCEMTSRTTAILLPSTKDIISTHAAWPQPMFDKAALGIHKRVKCLPNPCLFSINEVVLGASTADVLRDVRGQEIVIDVTTDPQVKGREGEWDKDAMSRTIRHLHHQRHFYPILPAPSDLPLDVTHSRLASFPGVTPDVLILPSVLTPFARVVDGTVIINPGPCARGTATGKGSYASMQVQALDKTRLEELQTLESAVEATKITHQLYDRARVDIIRM